MSDDKIYNDTITIESVEQKNDRVTLVAHNKNRYSFWATRKARNADDTPLLDQNGQQVMEDSAAMLQFKNMGLRKGSTVKIGFVIEGYTDKQGVARESKKIINFQETNDEPSQGSTQEKSSVPEAFRGQSGETRDAFGRRLGVQGHINALLSNPNYYAGGEDTASFAEIVKEAIAIEDEAEKQLNPSAFRQAVARSAPSVVEELPTIQQDEWPNIEDTPF